MLAKCCIDKPARVRLKTQDSVILGGLFNHSGPLNPTLLMRGLDDHPQQDFHDSNDSSPSDCTR